MKRVILMALASAVLGLFALAGCNECSKCGSGCDTCGSAPVQAAPAK